MKKIELFPSLMAGDLLDLRNTIKNLEPYCDGFHIDVMDYHFVPNLTWGPPVINALAHENTKPLWIHLMVTQPWKMIAELSLRSCDIVDFHIETKLPSVCEINFLREKKINLSVALSPKTNLEKLSPVFDVVDQVTLMSVDPGFSGQPFFEGTWERLAKLVAWRVEAGLSFTIAIDGGVSSSNLSRLIQAGATRFALGSSILGASDPLKALQQLYVLAQHVSL